MYDPEKFWDQKAKNLNNIGGSTRAKFQEQFEKEFELFFRWYLLYRPQGKILEVGCAEGRVVQSFWKKGIEPTMTMCDISNEYRKRCFKETKIYPDRWDGRTLPYKDRSFGLVISDHVLLHVEPDLIDDVWKEHVRVSEKYLYLSTSCKRYSDDVEGHFYHEYGRLFEETNLLIKEEEKFGKRRANWWLEKV